MRRLLLPLSLSMLWLSACDEAPVTADAGEAMDAGRRDAGTDAGPETSEDAGSADAGAMIDGGPSCGAAQHLCDGVCTSPMPDDPANGCRLGCGDSCPGGADAICEADGTCGLMGCTAMTCEELSVECGTTDDGCGTRIGCGTCAGSLRCESGACVCDGDPLEPNDGSSAATTLTALSDNPDSSVSVTTATVHRSDDEDWFRATVENNCCGGDPLIEVSLSGLPAGEDYDLAAWYQCPDGSTPICTMGTDDASVASGGCRSASVGPDTVAFDTDCNPDGVLFVRVRPFGWGGNCGNYRLDIAVN